VLTQVQTDVVILVVGFRNPDAIAACLQALRRSAPSPRFEVFIAENGGVTAMARLVGTLSAPHGPCRLAQDPAITTPPAGATRHRLLHLLAEDGQPRARVHVAEMAENLGYAGGINAWLRPLMLVPAWKAAWILNPDTEPSPTALVELADYSNRRQKGMVAASLVTTPSSTEVQLRGLAWSKFSARSVAIDRNAPRAKAPAPGDIESRMAAPSGASMYVRRELIEVIGLMDDDYFLYYEDLEWGFRAMQRNEVGYADQAIVPHKGGSTIRSGSRATASPLAVYLEFRNRILFMRKHLPRWAAWTILMQGLHIALYAAAGARDNTVAACRGLAAGVRGETGRPERFMEEQSL
jgi:N-acetylglucosaminyl-diphospho-decaprenol L-rhamnosyltransferase